MIVAHLLILLTYANLHESHSLAAHTSMPGGNLQVPSKHPPMYLLFAPLLSPDDDDGSLPKSSFIPGCSYLKELAPKVNRANWACFFLSGGGPEVAPLPHPRLLPPTPTLTPPFITSIPSCLNVYKDKSPSTTDLSTVNSLSSFYNILPG